MQTVVLYHAGCADGTCAAALLRQAFDDNSRWGDSAEIQFVPCRYDVNLDAVLDPLFVGHGPLRLVFADFCLDSVDAMKRALLKSAETFVFDHHATAEKVLEQLSVDPDVGSRLQVHFDRTRSGAGIVYDFLLWNDGTVLHPGFRPLVGYVQDRDLWQFKLPYSKEVGAYLRAKMPLDQVGPEKFAALLYQFDQLDRWINSGAQAGSDNVIRVGYELEQARQRNIEAHRSRVYMTKLANRVVTIVNISLSEIVSDTLHKAALVSPSGVAVGWYYGHGAFNFSLRSTKDGPDVAAMCEEFGGGGHPHAAGFQLVELDKAMSIIKFTDAMQWTDELKAKWSEV